jgi:heme/copper-type cytochrome/quinol oxidase subunit 3
VTETPHAAHGGHGGGHGDDHGHGHGSRFIQHHYDDAQHQFDAGKLGIWLFLAQEVLFFSALFVAYILYRHHHPEIYSYAHKYLDVKYGAINTAVLIFSSLTAAWAVRCAQLNQKKGLIVCIVLTLGCALAFLGIKYIEYSHKYHEHLLFGKSFDPCVSSGGVPLLTKQNDCHGSKTSVHWDAKAGVPKTVPLVTTSGPPQSGPQSGAVMLQSCWADLAIDQSPNRKGVQPACKVFELKVGNTTYTKPGDKQAVPALSEISRREITKQCPDPLASHGGGHGDANAYPCWRAAAQPAVCNNGWFFSYRCVGACSPNGGELFAAEGPFATRSACNDAKYKTESQLKGKGDSKVGECMTGGASGFIVEYGDHEARGDDVAITAECRPPPMQLAADDPLADVSQRSELGTPAISQAQRPTTHDLHAIEAAGPPPENTNMFFTIYFAMTGLHGIHVFAGVVVFLWLLIRAIKGHFNETYFGPIDYAALYWHIVDLIWIFLFPLLYLIH